MVESFSGKYTNTLDVKNRVFVPAAYRERLGSKFMLTRGEEKYLNLYPKEAWEEFEEQIKKLQTTRDNYMAIMRHYFNNAVPCSMDSQGRIVVPQDLKEWAGLTKDIMFAGVQSKVEIWDPANYEEKTKAVNIKEILEVLPINFPL